MIIENSNFSFIDFVNEDGKGRPFRSRFIEAGLVNYENEGLGQVLVKKETIDKFLKTMVGCPVIINHKTITNENVKDESVGFIHNVWFNVEDGWFWCDGLITDAEAMKLINDGISVSCSYRIKELSDEGGYWHDNSYDKELIDAEFLNLALVANPRYEDATILLNSSERKEKMFKLFSKKGEKEMKVDNAIDKNKIKDDLLEMINKLLKGKDEIEGESEESFYKKINEMLDKLSYDKDERAKEKEAEEEKKGEEKEEKKLENECVPDLMENSEANKESEKVEEKTKADEDKKADKEVENSSFEAINNASKIATVSEKVEYSNQAERIALGKKLF